MSNKRSKDDFKVEDIDERMRDVIAAGMMRRHNFNGN